MSEDLFEENLEYKLFEDKFKPKKTTDDCYTPPKVYDALLSWVKERYQIGDEVRIIRPFYPNGDYEREDYNGDCIVVDNPPFSILSSIVRFYQKNGIRFFLFSPTLTLFNSLNTSGVTAIPTDVSIVYENGAVVNTSFLTNLSPEIRVEGSVDLYRLMCKAQNKAQNPDKPKYEYPPEVVSAARIARLVRFGVNYKISTRESIFIRELDAQKPFGKSIFGGGLLLSSKQATEMKQATVWTLSQREQELVNRLGETSGD